jgi:hypothetical protein
MCEKTAVAPLLKTIAQPKHVSSGRKMKTNQFSTFITHDAVNNESIRLASCTVPDQVSSFCEPSVSVCVEGTVAILEPKQSLIPECFLTLWGTCVHFSS